MKGNAGRGKRIAAITAAILTFTGVASRKQGSMTTIIAIAARFVPALPLSKKNSGSPIKSAAAKQTICRFVRLKATFVLTLDRSLGTGTYAKKKPPFCP